MHDIDIAVCSSFHCLKHTYHPFFLQNDLYFIKKSNGKNNDEKESLMNKISELNLFIDRSEKELSKAKAVKEV
jgi:hypothetical protein